MRRHIKKVAKHAKKVAKKVRWHHPFLAGLLVSLIFTISVLVYRQMPFNSIGANILVADINLKGLTYNQAAEILENRFNELAEDKVTVLINDEEYEFSYDELGITLDPYQTIEKVYIAEYGEDYFDAIFVALNNVFGTTEVKPYIHSNKEQFEKALKAKVPTLKDPKEAKVVFDEEGQFTVIPHEDGLTALYEEPYQKLLSSAKNLESSELEISTQVLHASHKEEDLSNIASTANIYIQEPFTFTYKEGEKEKTFTVEFDETWVDIETEDSKILKAQIKRDLLKEHLVNEIASQINIEKQDAIIKKLPEEGSDYAEVEGVAKDGKLLVVEDSIDAFYKAIENNETQAELVVEVIESKVINETEEDLGKMELISTGLSNFETSPAGRDFNVRRGLNEKVNNIIIKPGGVYDFNKNLGPVTNSAGWQNSLAIFGGKNLIPVPGGGLCQVSTTVYRAAINAGMPILARSNHSLYVHYYKAYGEGLDAAIFPGVKNLKFKNDTDHYMLVQAYDDGYDAVVNIYGTSDGRTVDLAGPFYPKSIPDEFKDRIKLKRNQIGWWEMIKDKDGNVIEEKQLTGSYRSIPY